MHKHIKKEETVALGNRMDFSQCDVSSFFCIVVCLYGFYGNYFTRIFTNFFLPRFKTSPSPAKSDAV